MGRQGVESLLKSLAEHRLVASFFLAGADLREPAAEAAIKRMRDAGHYVGPQIDDSLPETLMRLRELGAATPGSSAFGLFISAAAADGGLASSSRKLEVELVIPMPGFSPHISDGNPGGLNGALLLLDLVGDDANGAFDPSRFGALAAQLARGGYETVRVDQLCAAAMRPVPRDPRYPPHCWTPAPTGGAPAWEILPQAAGPGEVILSKRHELGLLSNFAATPFTFHGKRYASLEGFWQMMKFPEGPDDPRAAFAGNAWPMTRGEVAAMTAFEAKAAGDVGSKNMNRMGIDWVSFEGRRFPYRPAEPGEPHPAVGIVRAVNAQTVPGVHDEPVFIAPLKHHGRFRAAVAHYFARFDPGIEIGTRG